MSVWFRFFRPVILFHAYLFFLPNHAFSQVLDCNSTSSPFYLANIADTSYLTAARYATVIDYRDSIVSLNMDIYRPGVQGNNLYNGLKPAVIFLYGGGFKQKGSTRTPFMTEMARYLSKKGFVVSVPNYRTGWENGGQAFCTGTSLQQFEDAMYRAQQDVRAAVRYLKGNAGTLKIDTNHVFVFGLSAGAVAAIGTLYEDTGWMTADRMLRLGMPDGNGNEYNVSSRTAGAIALAGAFTGRDIQFYDQSPVMFLHGTCDNAVLFNEGKMVSCPQTSYFYGPAPGVEILRNAGICYESHIFCGYDHTLSTKGMMSEGLPLSFDYIRSATSEFLYKAMCNNCSEKEIVASDLISAEPEVECSNLANYNYCNNEEVPSGLQIAIEPNHVILKERTFVHAVSDTERSIQVILYNMLGQEAGRYSFSLLKGANTLPFASDGLVGGQYQVYMYDGDKLVHRQKIIVESYLPKY